MSEYNRTQLHGPGGLWNLHKKLWGFGSDEKPWHFGIIINQIQSFLHVLPCTSKKGFGKQCYKTSLYEIAREGSFDRQSSYILFRPRMVQSSALHDRNVASFIGTIYETELEKLQRAYRNYLEYHRPKQ